MTTILRHIDSVKRTSFLLLFLFVFVTQAGVASEPRSEIEAAYNRTYRAASLKYKHGMLAHRSANFVSEDPDGRIWDADQEAESLDALLSKALQVTETGTVKDFKVVKPGLVECLVEDRLVVTIFSNPEKTKTKEVQITTLSLDTWKLTSSGWKQSRCKVLENLVSD